MWQAFGWAVIALATCFGCRAPTASELGDQLAATDGGLDEARDEPDAALLDTGAAEDDCRSDWEFAADGVDGEEVTDALVCDDVPKVGCPCESWKPVVGMSCDATWGAGGAVWTWAACDGKPHKDCPCEEGAKGCCLSITAMGMWCGARLIDGNTVRVWECFQDCGCDPGPYCEGWPDQGYGACPPSDDYGGCTS